MAMQPNLRMLQEMQSRMMKIQEELGEEIVTGSAGGGAVTCQMTGLQELKSVSIKPEAVDSDDIETLEADRECADIERRVGSEHSIVRRIVDVESGAEERQPLILENAEPPRVPEQRVRVRRERRARAAEAHAARARSEG